ncbi:hypothetical protein VTK73DRAFT_9723 [Phialemonium thermophilum]|uniref:Uncharacterized protein n=1 Tax=Phialemonium thermophilum TaxID=223376 RepID=A0ABR3XJR9_9PEZI
MVLQCRSCRLAFDEAVSEVEPAEWRGARLRPKSAPRRSHNATSGLGSNGVPILSHKKVVKRGGGPCGFSLTPDDSVGAFPPIPKRDHNTK